MAVLISDEMDFKGGKRDRGGHYIMIKGDDPTTYMCLYMYKTSCYNYIHISTNIYMCVYVYKHLVM